MITTTTTASDRIELLEWQLKAEVELITTLGQCLASVRLT